MLQFANCSRIEREHAVAFVVSCCEDRNMDFLIFISSCKRYRIRSIGCRPNRFSCNRIIESWSSNEVQCSVCLTPSWFIHICVLVIISLSHEEIQTKIEDQDSQRWLKITALDMFNLNQPISNVSSEVVLFNVDMFGVLSHRRCSLAAFPEVFLQGIALDY